MHIESPNQEQLLTIREAAEALGLPYYKIQRSVQRGLLPSYRLLNSRRYVRLRDIHEKMSLEPNTITPEESNSN